MLAYMFRLAIIVNFNHYLSGSIKTLGHAGIIITAFMGLLIKPF